MLSALLAWSLAATIGQAAGDAAWLKALPADAEVVVYARGVGAIRDDAMAMLKAMSPALAEQAEPGFTAAIDQMSDHLGSAATTNPFLVGMRLPKPDMQDPPAFAVLIPAKDTDAIVKSLSGGGDVKLEKQDGGIESFKDRDGTTIYVYKGDGFVAFGPMKDDMVRAIAAKPSENFAGKAPAESQKLLFAGDLGMYVNLAAVQTQYSEQIAAAEEQFLAMMDQAAGQMQAAQIEQAKAMYKTLFETMKIAESLTLSVDADKEAFDLSGLLTVKADSASASTLKTAKLGDAAELAKMPATDMGFFYVNFDPNGMEGMMQANLANAAAIGADADALKKSMEASKAAGRQQVVASFSLAKPVTLVTLSTAEHPEKAIEAAKLSWEQMKAGSPFMKDVTVEENALEYKGFKFAKTSMTMDFEKMAGEQAAGNPEVGQMMKRMMGDGRITTYYGFDGKRSATIVAESDDAAKAALDGALGGSSNNVGSLPGYQAVRSRLPKEVGGLVIFNAQAMVSQISGMIGRLMGGEIPTPSMPKEPALFGMSFAATPAGYRFDVVVPSAVGPVFEQGFGGMVQALQGQVNN